MSRTEKTAVKYRGEVATGYDAKRTKQEKWRREQEIISKWMMLQPPGISVLDCPVGTGRFLSLYAAQEFQVTGIDISPDMLAQARAKVPHGANITLREGSIFDLGDGEYEVSLAIRIMNLIERRDMQRALVELQRVTTSEIIFNLREGVPGKYRHPHPLSAVEAALLDGWYIAENMPIHEEDFRMIRLRNAVA